MSTQDFISLQKLGEGSFGTVEKVRRISDGQQYAMKTVKYMQMKEKDKKNALNEVRILASVEHPNVIQYKEAFFEDNSKILCTVMELAPNGDLAGRIKDKIKNNQTFYEYEIWSIGKDIINGVAALHQANILHRDIKPANIFFGEGDVAKIGDLNVSTLMKGNLAYTQTGTPYYASPEVWNNEPYAFECDVWSVGCVLYEMCALRKPFEAKNIDQLYQKVKRLKYDPLPYRLSDELAKVIQKCLCYRNERITISELQKIFERNCAPSYLQSQPSSGSIKMMQTIRLPPNRQQFAKHLPKPKYQNQEQKSQPATETSIQENVSILDKFLLPEKKLPIRRSYLTLVRSEKCLGSYLRPEPGMQSPSFKEVIGVKSPGKVPSMDYILSEQLSLRRNRIRIGLAGY